MQSSSAVHEIEDNVALAAPAGLGLGWMSPFGGPSDVARRAMRRLRLATAMAKRGLKRPVGILGR